MALTPSEFDDGGIKTLKTVTSDGVKTFGTLLNELYSTFVSAEAQKYSPALILKIGSAYLHHFGSGHFTEFVGAPANSRFMVNAVTLQSSSDYYRYLCTAGSNTISQSNMTTTVPTSGMTLELLYCR